MALKGLYRIDFLSTAVDYLLELKNYATIGNENKIDNRWEN